MSLTTLAPNCASVRGTQKGFALYQDLFLSEDARRIGLQAIAQKYTISYGDPTKDGGPIFLTSPSDPETGSTFDQVQAPFEGRISRSDVQLISREFAAKQCPEVLIRQMIATTSDSLWLIAFPRLIILQADNIAQELGAALGFNQTLYQSDWARAAFANICAPAPTSAHDKLALITAITSALDVARTFHPQAIKDARNKGYVLGDLDAEDFEKAFAIA